MPSTFAPHMCDGNRDVVYYRSFALAQPFHLACVDSDIISDSYLCVILRYFSLFRLVGFSLVGKSASNIMGEVGNRWSGVSAVVVDVVSSNKETFGIEWHYICNRCAGVCSSRFVTNNLVVAIQKNALKFASSKKKMYLCRLKKYCVGNT